MASKKSSLSRARSATDWSSGNPPFRAAARQAVQPNSQPASYLPPTDLIGTTPDGTIPPPSPQQFEGMPSNLPGIAGGPPALGSAPVTPPALTLPPVSGYQGQGQSNSSGQAAQWQPPSNLPADGNLAGWTPSGAPGPSPQQFQGMPGNLPGIAGGPPALGSAPVAPPKITPPPIT